MCDYVTDMHTDMHSMRRCAYTYIIEFIHYQINKDQSFCKG